MGRAGRWLQRGVFAFVIRPLLWLLIGLRVRNHGALPSEGPAILVANHNSHLDTIVLMSLFDGEKLATVRPAAAADYFAKPGLVSWISRAILNIIAIDRSGVGAEVALQPVRDALGRGEVVILYPEGTRGEPEKLERFRRGIALLISVLPEVPVVPVFMHGLGRALPKGERVLVPFFCDVICGDPMELGQMPANEIPTHLAERIGELGKEIQVGWHEEASDPPNG